MKFVFLSSHAHYALDPEATRVSGGAELQVALLARELATRGHDAVIIGGDTGQKDGTVFGGVRTMLGGRFHTGGWKDTLAALPVIAGIIRRENPDYLVVFGWTSLLWVMALFRRLCGYKLIFICGLDTEVDGSFGLSHGWRGRLFERGIREADLRFAMSDFQSAAYRLQGLAHAVYRSLVVPRKSPRITEKTEDLLWIGRCQKIKRPHRFLDLSERLPWAKCTMICSREDAPLWEEVASRAAGIPNVTFIERVPYSGIQAYYDRSKLLVSTSEAEGVPNVMIQAAQGDAGIVALEGDPDGMIGRFGAGVTAGGDFELMVTELSRLLNDPDALASVSSGASRIIAEWLDNGANAEAFLNGLERQNA
jgi:glycosyltransferase involved in cell wall biosynthesis